MSDIAKKRYYLHVSVFSVKVYVCKRDNLLPAQTTVFQCPKLHHELCNMGDLQAIYSHRCFGINYTTFPKKKSRVFFTDAKQLK